MNDKHRVSRGLWAIAIVATLGVGCDSAKEAAPKDKSAAKSSDDKAPAGKADAKPAKADPKPAEPEPAADDDTCDKLVDKLHTTKAPFFEDAEAIPELVGACKSTKIATTYKATVDCMIGAADLDAIKNCDQADPMLKAMFKPLMEGVKKELDANAP